MRLKKAQLLEFRQKISGMKERGLSIRRIAQLTKRDHSTIRYHLNADFAMIKRAKMRKRHEVEKRIKALQEEWIHAGKSL